MAEKNIYIIHVNGEAKNGEKFSYTYSRMNVVVRIQEECFSIFYQTSAEKGGQEIWESNIVDDATRKCLLAQLILFGQNPPFKEAIIRKAGSSTPLGVFTNQMVYSLIPNGKIDLSPIRDPQFITNYLMNTVQSDYEEAIAAIFSYIFAKTKVCEEEKFTYYWRSFNGIYNSMAAISEASGDNEYPLDSEKKCLQNWLVQTNNGERLVSSYFNSYRNQGKELQEIEKAKRHLFYKIRDCIAKTPWAPKDVLSALNNGGNRNKNLANVLGLSNYLFFKNQDYLYSKIFDDGRTLKSSLYGYLMTEFAYHLRCEYFHAAQPILLYSNLSNPWLRGLQLSNILIEHYLDNNLKQQVISKIELERELE